MGNSQHNFTSRHLRNARIKRAMKHVEYAGSTSNTQVVPMALKVEPLPLDPPWDPALPALRFPVVCPVCAAESLAAVSAETIAAALQGATAITLRSPCHAASWLADPEERAQIGDYLTVFLAYHRRRPPPGPDLHPTGSARSGSGSK
jgi:hypothetical protein